MLAYLTVFAVFMVYSLCALGAIKGVIWLMPCLPVSRLVEDGHYIAGRYVVIEHGRLDIIGRACACRNVSHNYRLAGSTGGRLSS